MRGSSAKGAAKKVLLASQDVLSRLESSIESDISRIAGYLSRRKGKIVVTGVGKSAFVGMKAAATFNSLNISAVFLHPVDALHGDLGIASPSDTVLAISNSGESEEVLRVASHLSRRGLPILSITGSAKSSLARKSKFPLLFEIKDEGSPYGLAPMASITASLVICDLLAAALSTKRGFRKEHFAQHHPGGSLGLQLTPTQSVMLSGKDVPSVADDTRIADVLKEITRKKFGTTGVCNKRGTLVGVITDGDLRRALLSKKFSYELRASQIMTKNPKTISGTQTLHEALLQMERNKITALFVTNGTKKCIGMIHMHQILGKKTN